MNTPRGCNPTLKGGPPDELYSFLDELTLLDAAGIYLLVSREGASYTQRFDETRLANLLYMVNVLGNRNEYEVICGYSDFVGVLLKAAGATANATGWFQSTQRRFHRGTFLRQPSGGAAARLMYSSGELLNSILLSEVQTAHEVGELTRILSGVGLDSIVTSGASPVSSAWNRRNSEIHHWQTIKKLGDALVGDPQKDVSMVLRLIDSAAENYTELKARGVAFERTTDSHHLDDWRRAITSFKSAAQL